MTLQEWVRAARAHKGWSLQHLGDLIGRSKAAVGHWETGTNEPSWDLVQAVHRATGYPLPGLRAAEPSVPYESGVAQSVSLQEFETPHSRGRTS